jgi:DNA-binding SARP family transcriptional activator/WD40 repeat protein
MEFRVLGVVEALEDGLPVSLGGPKQRSVLAMLLLDAHRAVSTDRLVDGLWGDDPPLRAAATLQVYVSNLRKALEPDRSPRAEPTVLLTQAPGYLLAVDPEQVDLFRFERMVGVARALAAEGCAAGAAVLFREALALWREAPLADLSDEPFATYEVPRLEEARIAAIEDRIDANLALGSDVDIAELESLVARNAYRERLRRQLMVALYRAGRQVDALAAYQAARHVLVEELGIEPSRELRDVEAAVLVQDPELEAVEPAPLTADDVARVLKAANGVQPEPSVIDAIVADAAQSARRAEAALRDAIDREQSHRLSTTLTAAGETQVELVRARRVIADGVLDRRRRHDQGTASRRPGTARPRNGSAVGACPYKGLLRFEPEDAGWYFGRERLVAELLATVASARCTGIVGASGSGKSSLTRAGLIAALADDALPGSARWPRVLVTPGADPMLELARALAPLSHAASADHVRDRLLEDPASIDGFAARAMNGTDGDASVMIVVDQLEEVFTVCRDDQVRTRFLDVLVHAAADPDSPSRVLAAVRSDYYARCAEHAEFAELLGRTNLLVGPMRPDELQRAIEEPARRASLVLEDGLLDRVFEDVGTEPGALPLLETALLETWTRRDDRTLTIEGYEASGGVRGAVAHLADEVYVRMSRSEQDVARAIFLRLAEPGERNDDVRRRAPLDELVIDDEHATVLASLVEHRLVVTGDATAEVAHEALLREWPRVRGWLEEDREGRRVQRALANTAQEWDAAARDDDLLFRGSRLAAALDVADAQPAGINPLEREFLVASRAQQDAELRGARRTARRFRRLTVALSAFLVIAIVAGVVSLIERSRADDNASRADAQARASAATSLATQARALLGEQAGLSLLLLVEARRLHPSIDTDGALESALASSLQGVEAAFTLSPRSSPYPNPSPDGTLVAVPGVDGFVRLLDARTGRVVRRLEGQSRSVVVGALFNGDGSLLSVGGYDGKVMVWEVASGRRIARLDTGAPGIAYGTFDSTDGRLLYTVSQQGQVRRWDLHARDPRPEDLFTVPAGREGVLLFFVSPDGRLLLVGEQNTGPTSLWDLHTGTRLGVIDGIPSSFGALGRTFITTTRDGRVEVRDIETLAVLETPVSFTGAGSLVSSNGKLVAVKDTSTHAIHVVDVATRTDVVPPITLHTSDPFVRFLPGERLFTASAEKIVIVRVDPKLSPLATILDGTRTPGTRANFTRDGRVATFNPIDGERVWNTATGARVDDGAAPGDEASGLVSSPDLRKAVVVGADGSLRLTDARRDRPGAMLPIPDHLFAIAWSPDSSMLALAFPEYTALYRVDDVARPKRIARLQPGGGLADALPWVTSVAFSPDSRRVAVVKEHAGVATLFDTASGRRLRVFTLAGGDTMSQATFSPDGRTLAVAVAHTAGVGDLGIGGQGPVTGSVVFFGVEAGAVRETLTLRSSADSPELPRGVAYIDEGRRVATLHVAEDGTGSLKIWDPASQRLVGEPLVFPAAATQLDASPDGGLVVHGSDAGFAVVWDVDPARWSALACSIAGRSLTPKEWDQYLPGRPYDPECNA